MHFESTQSEWDEKLTVLVRRTSVFPAFFSSLVHSAAFETAACWMTSGLLMESSEKRERISESLMAVMAGYGIRLDLGK